MSVLLLVTCEPAEHRAYPDSDLGTGGRHYPWFINKEKQAGENPPYHVEHGIKYTQTVAYISFKDGTKEEN